MFPLLFRFPLAVINTLVDPESVPRLFISGQPLGTTRTEDLDAVREALNYWHL